MARLHEINPQANGLCLPREANRFPSASLCRDEFYPDKEQNNRTDDRQNESGWVKRGAGSGLGKNPRDQAADDRAANAEQRGGDETEMLRSRHNGARKPTDDKTDND
jgi:hypothetical protein